MFMRETLRSMGAALFREPRAISLKDSKIPGCLQQSCLLNATSAKPILDSEVFSDAIPRDPRAIFLKFGLRLHHASFCFIMLHRSRAWQARHMTVWDCPSGLGFYAHGQAHSGAAHI